MMVVPNHSSNQMWMRFVPDDPIRDAEHDLLGFHEFVEMVKASIIVTQAPFVYGILGDWGVGKTSILRLLENIFNYELNKQRKPFVPIWFNAWEYENETNIVYPLLHSIKADFETRLKSVDQCTTFRESFLDVVGTSFLALTDLGLRVSTKHLTGEALKMEDLEKHLKSVGNRFTELERVMGEWANSVDRLKKAFNALLTNYAEALSETYDIKSSPITFVILIDDLDRCLPNTAISILESIKNYLSVENVVFVLGINPQVIYQGIKQKYQGQEVDGREYLEKILNYTFYVPEPSIELVAKFAFSRLKELTKEDLSSLKNQKLLTEFGFVLRESNFNNPRKIKRVLNRYLLYITKYGEICQDQEIRIAIRLMIIAEYFPYLFQLYLTDADIEDISQLGEREFDMEVFEKKYGVKIATIYPQLCRMKNLFKMDSTSAARKRIRELAQTVYNISRIY